MHFPRHLQAATYTSISLTVLIMQFVFRVSRRGTSFLIQCIIGILEAAGASPDVIARIPKDPRTMVGDYDIEPILTPHLSCPKCFALYPLDPRFQRCTYRKPGATSCDVPLWVNKRIGPKTLSVPRRKYMHQEMTHWMGRMLSRPGIEDIIDQYKPDYQSGVPHRVDDIIHSKLFHLLIDRDCKPFFQGAEGEGRYVYSLAVDGFNPFHMKEAKQSASSTGIWMVLLNLPPALRYLPENMYMVGVIPGPNKPSLDEINHALDLLVNDLELFWDPGVWYTRTWKYPAGRLVNAMLVPLVNDMPSSRQISGFGAHNSKYFCTHCYLTIQDIENLDKTTWPRRKLADHVKCAHAWKAAASVEEQQRLFDAHGIRWSVLLRLKYMNPSLFSVPDSFHALYLGGFQNHCRNALGISVNVDSGDGSALRLRKEVPRPSNATFRKWLRVIRDNPPDLRDTLASPQTTKNILWHICHDNNLRFAGTKRLLADNIVEWVRAALHRFLDSAHAFYRETISAVPMTSFFLQTNHLQHKNKP